jgi:hypothetical protein
MISDNQSWQRADTIVDLEAGDLRDLNRQESEGLAQEEVKVEQIQIQEPPELDQIDSRQENHKEEEQEEQGIEQMDADSFEDL